MGTSPSTNISTSSTKKPNFCTEMIKASYSSPRCCSMNCAFFRLACDFLRQPLVVLRPNLKIVRTRKGNNHRALTNAGPPAGSSRRGNASMANGDPLFREPGYAQRVAESVRQFFKFDHLFRVGFFVNAVER